MMMTPEQVKHGMATGQWPKASKGIATPTVAAKARPTKYGPRHVTGVMNGTESKYAELLTARHIAGEVQSWSFESHTFRLADGLRFTPDFEVVLADGTIEFVDVKGSTNPKATDPKSRVKIKSAAQTWPHYRFVVERRIKGGGFEREEIGR